MTRKRGMLVLLFTTLLAVLAAGAVASPAQAATTYKQITNNGNSKCIDVATQNNYTVQLWSCNGGSQQKWSEGYINPYFNFVNQRTGKCLDVAGSGVGAVAVVNTCNANYSQLWQVIFADNPAGGHGWYQQLQNAGSGLCLDLYNNSSSNGTVLQQYWCYPTQAQYWNM